MSNLRILIDKDDVLYAFVDHWYELHNKEYGSIHTLTADEWEDGQRCKDNNCPVDIFQYFTVDTVWKNGLVYPDSQRVINSWLDRGYDLGIITKIANPIAAKAGWEWLQIHYPRVKNIIMATAPKAWVQADILIDDSPKNLIDFKGVAILFDQKWNRGHTTLPRAQNWNEVEEMVKYIENRLNYYRIILPDLLWAYKHVEQELIHDTQRKTHDD